MKLAGTVNKPASIDQIIKFKDDDNYITGLVRVYLAEIIDNDLEGFLDLISEKLTGSTLLMDIEYRVVGHESANDLILLEVSGDVSSILDMAGNNNE